MALPNLEDWVAPGRDSMIVKLLAPGESGLRQVASFQPEFTHAIFGAEDQIFGYKKPRIELRYRANDMRPHLKISHSGKLRPVGEAEPTDIIQLLQDGHHLPKVAFATEKDFEDSSLQLANNWTPPGQLHSSYTSSDGTYEIWKGRLDEAAIKQMNLRVQILVPMFIEGGSYIGDRPDSDSPDLDLSDADRWTVFFLYRKAPIEGQPDKHTYTFAGFSTVYRFYYFRNPTPPASPDHSWELPKGDLNLEELPCRTRLSQFLILPPFQQKGNGAYLYKAIFEHYLKHPQTQEFNVEDPNEAFDDLRDVCDLAYLRTVPEFTALRLDTNVSIPKKGPVPQLIVGGDAIESIRQKTKIFPRQFNRVLEMYLMSQLPDSVRPSMPLIEDGEEVPMEHNGPAPTKAESHMGKIWGLVVKQRLYRHNRDVLSQIDLPERREKLEETKESVGLEYARVLALYDRAMKHNGSSSSANGKRKSAGQEADGTSKRARTEDA